MTDALDTLALRRPFAAGEKRPTTADGITVQYRTQHLTLHKLAPRASYH